MKNFLQSFAKLKMATFLALLFAASFFVVGTTDVSVAEEVRQSKTEISVGGANRMFLTKGWNTITPVGKELFYRENHNYIIDDDNIISGLSEASKSDEEFQNLLSYQYLTSIRDFNGNGSGTLNPMLPGVINTMRSFVPGMGYWIKMMKNSTIEMPAESLSNDDLTFKIKKAKNNFIGNPFLRDITAKDFFGEGNLEKIECIATENNEGQKIDFGECNEEKISNPDSIFYENISDFVAESRAGFSVYAKEPFQFTVKNPGFLNFLLTPGWNAVTPTNDTVYYVGQKPNLGDSFKYEKVSDLKRVFGSIKGVVLLRGQNENNKSVTYNSAIPSIVNTLKYIAPGQGYQIKVDQNAVWQLEGLPFFGTLKMSLREGYNLIGNPFYSCDLTKEEFFGDALDLVEIVKDPETDEKISMEEFGMISGKAVWVKMSAPADLEITVIKE